MIDELCKPENIELIKSSGVMIGLTVIVRESIEIWIRKTVKTEARGIWDWLLSLLERKKKMEAQKKAFDLQDLGNKLKAKGLPVAEQAAEQVYEAVKEWLVESGNIQGGLVQGVIGVAIPAVDGFVKGELNKIDGQPG